MLGAPPSFRAGNVYCAKCGDYRRVEARPLSIPSKVDALLESRTPRPFGPSLSPRGVERDEFLAALAKASYQLNLLVCDAEFYLTVFNGPTGIEILILSSSLGGLGTPHTPLNVSYYLDQAHRAAGVGANSAAVSMYRSAVEMILHQQGYIQKMLGPKVAAVQLDKTNGSGPVWIGRVDVAVLDVLGRLGNAAVHPNNGDVAAQALLDSKLLFDIQEAIRVVLQEIYEIPLARAQTLERLKNVADRMPSKSK